MTLERREPKAIICSKFEEAKTFKQRLVGLIGTRDMRDFGMYFKQCNWIHTFFMSLPIDVIYVDKQMKIKKIDHSLKPWRLPLPVFNATSVIEVAAGVAKKYELQVGEELHVGH